MVMTMMTDVALDTRSEAAIDSHSAVHTSQLHTTPRATACTEKRRGQGHAG